MTPVEAREAMIVGPLAALGLYAFLRVWQSEPAASPSPAGAGPYRIGDIGLGSLFGIYFLLVLSTPESAYPEINAKLLVTNIVWFAMVIGWILGFLVARGLNPIALFGLAPPRPGRKMLLAIGLLVTAWPLIELVDLLAKTWIDQADRNQDVVRFFIEKATPGERGLLAFAAVVAAPLGEELIFRGYLYGILKQHGGRWCAVAVSSMLFAAIHLHWPSIPGLFLLAVVLCLVYEKLGTLWAPIAMHVTFNGISLLLLILWPQAAL